VTTLAEIAAAAPEPLLVPGARATIRDEAATTGRRIAVLDDDPTGSQTVHGVNVVTVTEPETVAAGLEQRGSTCFVLTNSRSLAEADAAALSFRLGTTLHRLGQAWDAPVTVVSRSDSTLRGHLLAEVRALDDAVRAATGSGYDGVLLAPAYLEAGRVTAGDVHWARVGDDMVPVAETEFAQDATFGFPASDLKDFVVGRGGGTIAHDDVTSLSLEDIRSGGPTRVAAVLSRVHDGRFVVVNALDDADLDVVVLGLLEAETGGRRFLHRTGPSFVRALAGLDPRPPLTADDIWPDGRRDGHGLVVVGSHVGLTRRQVDVAAGRGGLVTVELPVDRVVDPGERAGTVASVSARVSEALADDDVLLCTSRSLRRGRDADDSLRIARSVSQAVTDVVGRVRSDGLAWVVAKGGITSHDVAVRGLGIRRATVLGQLFPGTVSVFRADESAAEVRAIPFVVFAGNVGDDSTLADVIERMRAPLSPGRE
jgi:uncharacterized protein YgbK (DUF1537 family)